MSDRNRLALAGDRRRRPQPPCNMDKADISAEARTLPGASYPLHLVAFLTEHLVWMRLLGRADTTLFHRRRAVVLLAEYLGHDPVSASYDELFGWQRHLLATSRDKVRHQTVLVRPYYRWLVASGHRGDDPSALLPCPRATRGLPRPIPECALARAIEHAPARLLPWLLLAGWCGLRAAEIAQLRVDSFFGEPGVAWWVRVIGKGGTVRDVPVPAWIWPTIAASLAPSGAAWRRARGSGPVLPKHVSRECNKHLRSLDIPDTLHTLRHRVATLTYQHSGDIRLVQDLLGHATPTTTAIYTRVTPIRIAAALAELPQVELPAPRTRHHLHVVPTPHGGTG